MACRFPPRVWVPAKPSRRAGTWRLSTRASGERSYSRAIHRPSDARVLSDSRCLPPLGGGAKGWVGRTRGTHPLPQRQAPPPTHPVPPQAGPAASLGQMLRAFYDVADEEKLGKTAQPV